MKIADLPSGSIWLHVSTLMSWGRPPVGIVRVEQEYCRWLLAQPVDARFCVYDRAARQFLEVSRESVAQRLRLLALPQTAAHPSRAQWKRDIKGLLRRLAEYLPPRWTPQLREFALRAWVRTHRAVARLRGLARRLMRPTERTGPLAAPAAFGQGDRWVSLGLDWDTLDQVELYRLKQRHRLRTTLICYDVIPALFPQLVVLPPGGFGAYVVDLAWCADEVLCISEHTRSDFEGLLRRLGAPVPRTHVIRLGSELGMDPGGPSQPPAHLPHGPGARPFVLFVSTIERRKNHDLLYRAWVRLRERGVEPYRLVCVGMRGWGVTDLMHDLQLDPRVRDDILLLDRVDDAQLAWLYQNCAFTVFPSLYEGWGLPLVESLAWGKFCLASNAASLPEAGGPWAEYLDPWDLPAWVERLAHYMGQPQAVAEREARIGREFIAPRWADTAAAIHGVVIEAGAAGRGEAAP